MGRKKSKGLVLKSWPKITLFLVPLLILNFALGQWADLYVFDDYYNQGIIKQANIREEYESLIVEGLKEQIAASPVWADEKYKNEQPSYEGLKSGRIYVKFAHPQRTPDDLPWFLLPFLIYFLVLFYFTVRTNDFLLYLTWVGGALIMALTWNWEPWIFFIPPGIFCIFKAFRLLFPQKNRSPKNKNGKVSRRLIPATASAHRK